MGLHYCGGLVELVKLDDVLGPRSQL
jgi:hypothetical protein